MNKKIYWIGLPVCFVLLAAGTYLIPKTFESKFVIVQDDENAAKHQQVLTMDQNETYDLGLIRTKTAYNMYAYREVLRSDKFLRPLLRMHVRTLDGKFDGTYYDYCLRYMRWPLHRRIMRFLRPHTPVADLQECIEESPITWSTTFEESARNLLCEAIEAEVDYETEFVTVTCSSQDPLVSTMMAEAVQQALLTHVSTYQQAKMQETLGQLEELTELAKNEYEQNRSEENRVAYESFQRQQMIYRAQMHFNPTFTTISAPSFSYGKVSPSRIKIPFLLTCLIGLALFAWENRKKIKEYVLG